jgi:hypothetical protein
LRRLIEFIPYKCPEPEQLFFPALLEVVIPPMAGFVYCGERVDAKTIRKLHKNSCMPGGTSTPVLRSTGTFNRKHGVYNE